MDPDLELQGIIINRLRADPGVNALVGGRIFDTVQENTPFPYVTFGPTDLVSDDPECITSFELFLQIDVWSRYPGFPEAKRIADAIRVCLHDRDEEMQLSSNALVYFHHRNTQTMRDPDGLTNHSVLTFEASVERQ